jgi:glycosyltransferase involved in cell wall biosynthesis
MGWPLDQFVVMVNAANKGDPSRKGLREVLLAWQQFISSQPQARLYLHTERFGVWGVPLAALADQLGLGQTVQFVDDYRYASGQISAADLNVAYNAADVLLNPALGEGFGVPILEAQAAGTPVIVTDFTAMSELCWAGWKIGGTRFMTPQNAYQMLPSVSAMVEALHAAYQQRGDDRLREAAVVGAQAYAVQEVYHHYWQPLLSEIMKDSQKGAA